MRTHFSAKSTRRHVGPSDLILQEIVALSEVPEEVRESVERSFLRDADRDAVPIEIVSGARAVPAPEGSYGNTWADVTFAGRALALVEGTGQPDHDGYGDPFVWVFALRAESPIVGEAIVSAGGFASNAIFLSHGPDKQAGKRLSFFAAIRTEPRQAGRSPGSIGRVLARIRELFARAD